MDEELEGYLTFEEQEMLRRANKCMGTMSYNGQAAILATHLVTCIPIVLEKLAKLRKKTGDYVQ
jgi:hypothetical protein